MGNKWKQWQILFSSAPKLLWMVTAARKFKDTCSFGRKVVANLDSVLKSRDITLPTKACIVKVTFIPVVMYYWMWEVGRKEGWVLKNWCFQPVVLEKTLEGPLDSKEIKPVNPKDNQSWIIIGRTNAETEGPIRWPLDGKSWLIGKDLNAGKDWRQEEKWSTEDEMVGWYNWLNEHGFEQTLGDSEDREAWCAAIYGVAKSQTWLSNWTIRRSYLDLSMLFSWEKIPFYEYLFFLKSGLF